MKRLRGFVMLEVVAVLVVLAGLTLARSSYWAKCDSPSSGDQVYRNYAETMGINGDEGICHA